MKRHGTLQQHRRAAVFRRDGYKCVYCPCTDRTKLTIDHKVARSKGGSNRFNNLQTCCIDCNKAKGAMTDRQFRNWMIAHPKETWPETNKCQNLAERTRYQTVEDLLGQYAPAESDTAAPAAGAALPAEHAAHRPGEE